MAVKSWPIFTQPNIATHSATNNVAATFQNLTEPLWQKNSWPLRGEKENVIVLVPRFHRIQIVRYKFNQPGQQVLDIWSTKPILSWKAAKGKFVKIVVMNCLDLFFPPGALYVIMSRSLPSFPQCAYNPSEALWTWKVWWGIWPKIKKIGNVCCPSCNWCIFGNLASYLSLHLHSPFVLLTMREHDNDE